jgi:uncharacterized protein YprB with RNaseH-like and TPR domain
VNLGDRLRRLRRAPEDAVAPPRVEEASAADSLERLERSLVGQAAEGLSLKARLERLVAAAARGRTSPERRAVSIEDLVPGRRVANDRGEFFLVESDVHLETHHGDVPLGRFHAVLPETVGILTGERGFAAFDLAQAIFLDTETTGLAGGTGTAAFLVGIGFLDGDRFRVRQYLMRDYHEEPALLHAVASDFGQRAHLVTFNGKMFDVPLLESRYRLNRERWPLAAAAHLDLLHPARRLWKMRLDSCRLQSLEAALLGVRRYGDVPGEEIPRIYFDYVRTRHAGALPRILEHNRMDILSLAALAVVACQWVEEGRAEDPRDVLSLGRVFERAERYDKSEAEYRRALAAGADEVRVPALLRLAQRAKRSGDMPTALDLWQEAAAAGEPLALRELAMHHEHRSRDLAAALAAAERGLGLVTERGDPASRRAANDFRRRHSRVVRKLARAGASG